MLTPEERGPAANWAYETRTLLGLSVEQVIERLPTRYHPATLRKAEGRDGQPSRQMWRELRALYLAQAQKKGIAIAPQPALVSKEPPVDDLSALIASNRDVAEALNRQADALAAHTQLLEALTGEVRERNDLLLSTSEATALFLGMIARSLLPGESDIEGALRSASADLARLRELTRNGDR